MMFQNTFGKQYLGCRLLTLDAGFPNSVGVLEARYNVIAYLEGEFQVVTTTFLQCKP